MFKLQAQSAPGASKAKAQSIINIFLPGGIAAQESFDPRMLAPVEFRGPLGGVKTSIEGVYFSEVMKNTAKVADKICVIRSMTHGEADHDRGTHNMFTGWRPAPPFNIQASAASCPTNWAHETICLRMFAYLPSRTALLERDIWAQRSDRSVSVPIRPMVVSASVI